MTRAKELAKEIADEINARWHNPPDYESLVGLIAAKLEPLVSDAERWKRECEAVRSLANTLYARADDADRYERWLLDIGRAIGCQHLDEQLPNCIIQHLQGDQESEATNE